MKHIYFIMFFVFVLLTSNTSATMGISTAGDKILSPGVIMLLLGDDPGDDPAEVNEWEVMEPMPEARAFHAVVADSDGYLYVIGGSSDAQGMNPTDTLFRYDTTNDKWDELEPLPANLFEIDAEVIDGKIYVPGNLSTANTYVYDINNQDPDQDPWSVIPADNGYTERAYYRTVAIGSDLYVLGGLVNTNGFRESTNEVWKLDTKQQTWSLGEPMLDDRISFAAGVIKGSIYVAGGSSSSIPNILSGEVFSFTSNDWSAITDIPDEGGNFWAYMADGNTEDALWLAGGKRDSTHPTFANYHSGFYDPATNEWTDSTSDSVPTLNHGRSWLSGTVASDGYFYAIGGRDHSLIDPHIYDTNERFRVK